MRSIIKYYDFKKGATIVAPSHRNLL